MKWFGWILACLALVVVGIGEWRFVSALRADLRSTGGKSEQVVPYDIRISGRQLQDRIKEELSAVNTARMARVDKSLGDGVVVEGVTYERNGGVVHAQGRIRDLSDGRRVLAVMDAYDADLVYLTSAATPIQTVRGNPVGFSLAMPDRMDLSTVSFRVLSEGDRSQISSINEADIQKRRADIEDRAILLLDDAVTPVDLQEAEERLRRLGYITAPQDVTIGEPAYHVIFNRFRKDHGLPPTTVVDIETFLALRIVTPDLRTRYQAEL